MREILFRGKRTDNGKWLEGCLDFNQDKSLVFIRTPHIIYTDVNMVPLSTVGQYTGLKDKNGKRIFEGDIVARWRDGERVIYEIKYEADIAAFIGETKRGRFTTFDGDSKYFELIGNIHDNPEMLEVR